MAPDVVDENPYDEALERVLKELVELRRAIDRHGRDLVKELRRGKK